MSHDPAMDSDAPNQFRGVGRSKQVFLVLLILAASVSALAWMVSSRISISLFSASQIGIPMPAIVAQGWINEPPPAAEELAGKVVVIEVWASWCGPCRDQMPKMVKLHKQFKSRDVVFVGLTVEGRGELHEVHKMVDKFGITWSTGWGAMSTIEALEANEIPALYIFGADGRLAWYSPDGGVIHEVLEREVRKAEAAANGQST